MRIQLFSLSLTGPAFGWYTTLPPGSITMWKQLEEQFHAHVFTSAEEATITNLQNVKQRPGEDVQHYIQCFREVRNRCYSLHLPEKTITEIARNSLQRTVRAMLGPSDCDSIGQLVSRVAAYERDQTETYHDKPKKTIGYVEADEEDSDVEANSCLV